jgi:hypothetical protein
MNSYVKQMLSEARVVGCVRDLVGAARATHAREMPLYKQCCERKHVFEALNGLPIVDRMGLEGLLTGLCEHVLGSDGTTSNSSFLTIGVLLAVIRQLHHAHRQYRDCDEVFATIRARCTQAKGETAKLLAFLSSADVNLLPLDVGGCLCEGDVEFIQVRMCMCMYMCVSV